MKLAKYKACICEGSAEEAIIDILVDNDLLKGSASECPSAGQSSGMSERGEEDIDIGLCGCKPRWRPVVLYAIQEIMAVYRNPYHQGTLLLSL